MVTGVIFISYRKICEITLSFSFGGAVYGALETLWRGYTHPTMILVGGMCMSVMYALNRRFRPKAHLCALYGCLIITSAEFISGCIINLWLGLGVWDYSYVKFNLLGQICLWYSLLWAVLSVPAFKMCSMIEAIFEDGKTSNEQRKTV